MTDSTPVGRSGWMPRKRLLALAIGCDRTVLRQTATDVFAAWLRANGEGK